MVLASITVLILVASLVAGCLSVIRANVFH